MSTPRYFNAFENMAMTRSESGVLTLRFHSNGGPAIYTGRLHADFPRALYEIDEDRDNRVLVLTGTGDRFMTDIDGASLGDMTKPASFDRTAAGGRRAMRGFIELEMPIIAAANGSATVHSEYVLAADIAIASSTSVFSDSHLTFGITPGDGVAIVWEEVLGFNRARYLTLTQGSFSAEQAQEWGAIAEVVPLGDVLQRAQQIAESLAERPNLLTRYLAVTVRERISRRIAEGVQLGLALEGLTAADLAYQSPNQA